jgi:hypothetical protein
MLTLEKFVLRFKDSAIDLTLDQTVELRDLLLKMLPLKRPTVSRPTAFSGDLILDCVMRSEPTPSEEVVLRTQYSLGFEGIQTSEL